MKRLLTLVSRLVAVLSSSRLEPVVTNLLVFLDKVTTCNDYKDSVDTIFLDFAKAFDNIPHGRLLMKLKAHGINGQLPSWIGDWLANRMQRVCISGATSGWRLVMSGVPQLSLIHI